METSSLRPRTMLNDEARASRTRSDEVPYRDLECDTVTSLLEKWRLSEFLE